MKISKLASTVLIILAISLYSLLSRTSQGGFKTIESSNAYYVKRAIDGDTIVLSNNERVRYIGIDTPEIHHPKKGVERMGKEAAEFNRKLVESKRARLEFDIEKRDKYGRLLAYVYVNDLFINAELVKQGYAQAYTFPPNIKYVDLFLRLQQEARENNRGLWGKR